MYVVFAKEPEGLALIEANTVRTLEQAFAKIACRCGLSYRFSPAEQGWSLEMTDVERPDRSPEPIFSTCIKPRDAQHDLMAQAVDGRIRGHVAVSLQDFEHGRRVTAWQSHGVAISRRGNLTAGWTWPPVAELRKSDHSIAYRTMFSIHISDCSFRMTGRGKSDRIGNATVLFPYTQ